MSEGPQAASPEDDDRLTPGRIARGAMRGAIAAMAMTGMRAATISIGLVEEAPPGAILRQKSRGVFRLGGKGPRRAVQELMHWGYGAAGGAGFAAIPADVRRKPWFGPAYGVVLWLSFEAIQAPLMGLKQAGKLRPVERAALAADHVLYGYVLSEMRRVSS